jgi:uncharacterized membrane protein
VDREEGPALPPPPAHLHPRIVPSRHALAWYEEAMRLFKWAPWPFAGLAAIAFAVELALHLAPGATALAAEVVVPVVACGLVYACAAADRRERPSLALAVRAFRAGAGAIAAVVAAGLATFAAQAFAGWWIADVNFLAPGEATAALSAAQVVGIYAIGILASLPFTFVPFHALLERVPPGAAFRASWRAFALNTLPLLAYAAASLALLGFGLLTAGLGLLVALPLWAASSYAAWKDVFGIRDAPPA